MKVLVDAKLFDDPKMYALAEHMGWNEDECVARLIRFWCWAQEQTETGNLSAYTPRSFARAMGVDGKLGEKIKQGMMLNPADAFLFQASKGLHVRNWWKYTASWWKSKYSSGTREPERDKKWRAIEAYCKIIDAEAAAAAGNIAEAPQKPDSNLTETEPRPAKARPASVAEVKEYGTSQGLSESECEKFFFHYEANGWVQGKNKPIKSWRAAIQTWKKNVGMFGGNTKQSTNGTTKTPPPVDPELTKLQREMGLIP